MEIYTEEGRIQDYPKVAGEKRKRQRQDAFKEDIEELAYDLHKLVQIDRGNVGNFEAQVPGTQELSSQKGDRYK